MEILSIKDFNWMTFQVLLNMGGDLSDGKMGFID